jgi:hypothetical protein
VTAERLVPSTSSALRHHRRCELGEEAAHGWWVYFLYEDDTLVYVGVSSHVRTRLKQHERTYGDSVTRVVTQQHPTQALAEAAELDAIVHHKPRDNRTAGTGRFPK